MRKMHLRLRHHRNRAVNDWTDDFVRAGLNPWIATPRGFDRPIGEWTLRDFRDFTALKFGAATALEIRITQD